MPGDDAALLTPGRMSQRGKEAGLHTPSKDLLTSPSLSPGVSYTHGKRTHTTTAVDTRISPRSLGAEGSVVSLAETF